VKHNPTEILGTAVNPRTVEMFGWLKTGKRWVNEWSIPELDKKNPWKALKESRKRLG